MYGTNDSSDLNRELLRFVPVVAAGTTEECGSAVRHLPLLRHRVPDSNVLAADIEVDGSGLALLDVALLKSTQHVVGLLVGRGRELDVELSYFLAVPASSAGHLDLGVEHQVVERVATEVVPAHMLIGRLERLGVLLVLLPHGEVVVLEGGVRQTVAEGETRFDVLGVEPLPVHQQSDPEVQLRVLRERDIGGRGQSLTVLPTTNGSLSLGATSPNIKGVSEAPVSWPG